MDNFAEQLVKKELTNSDKTKNVLTVVGGIALTIIFAVGSFFMLSSIMIAFIGMILAIACGCGTFLMSRNFNVEYEYTFTNGELDIDKIIAQSKRKPMLTIQISKFTDFGKYDENTSEETDEMTVILATNNIASKEYYADFPHEEFGMTRLIFCPNERMRENIVKFLPMPLRKKYM